MGLARTGDDSVLGTEADDQFNSLYLRFPPKRGCGRQRLSGQDWPSERANGAQKPHVGGALSAQIDRD